MGRDLAKLKDNLLKIDPAKGRITLAELCNQYLKTVQHRKVKTLERKTLIVHRLKAERLGGLDCGLGKIKPSDIQFWLAQYQFGSASVTFILPPSKAFLKWP